MAEDFGDEDVLGHVFGFKAFDADGGVGRAQVAWFPAQIALSEGGLDLALMASLVAIWARLVLG